MIVETKQKELNLKSIIDGWPRNKKCYLGVFDDALIFMKLLEIHYKLVPEMLTPLDEGGVTLSYQSSKDKLAAIDVEDRFKVTARYQNKSEKDSKQQIIKVKKLEKEFLFKDLLPFFEFLGKKGT